MNFQQKSIASMLAIMLIAFGSYFAYVYGLVGHQEIGQIEYKPALLTLLLAMVVLAIATLIVIAATKPGEAGEFDERDRAIGLVSGRSAGIVLSVCVYAVLGLVMTGAHGFWIAQALIASLALADIFMRVMMLVLYRRGL